MKKYAIASLAMVIAVAVPTAVSAAAKQYQGPINGGGTVEFAIKRTDNGKKLVKWIWRDMPAACNSGAEEVSGSISFKVRVKNGKFELDAIQGTPQNPTARMTAEGDVGRNNADGTIRVHGSAVPIDDGGTANCDTGKETWTASKV